MLCIFAIRFHKPFSLALITQESKGPSFCN
jgi:hypothetical protein